MQKNICFKTLVNSISEKGNRSKINNTMIFTDMLAVLAKICFSQNSLLTNEIGTYLRNGEILL